MNDRFAPRKDAIRAAAQAVCPDDCFVVLSSNLSHLGNGTFSVSLRRERDVPLAPEDCEPPDSLGEGGDDPEIEVVASCLVRWNADLARIAPALERQLGEAR